MVLDVEVKWGSSVDIWMRIKTKQYISLLVRQHSSVAALQRPGETMSRMLRSDNVWLA